METRRLINQGVRYALMTGAALAAASYAGTAVGANANTPAQLGKVTVTGTRIKRAEVETAQPITRISRQQIQKSGDTNLGSLLQRISQVSSSITPAVNDGGGSQSNVDLRNFGPNRNLVLVDGKRWLPGLSGTVNLGTIPVSVIDHIEILQDGASAVYGSDAITGVVNVITIKNFHGVEAHAHYGIHEADDQGGVWDGQEKQYDFTIGGGNDRGNVTFNTTYKEQNSYLTGARDISKEPLVGTGGGGSSPNTPKGTFQLFGPAVSGRAIGQGSCAQYDSSNPTAPLCNLTFSNAPATPSLQNFKNYTPADAYNERRGFDLQRPLKDISAYVQGHYDLFDNVTFTANAEYVREETVEGFSTAPLSAGVLGGGKSDRIISIAAGNPYNPFQTDLVADSSDPCIQAGTCIGALLLGRRPLEAGRRLFGHNRDFFHIFAGFNGYVTFFNREIDWDVGFAQNRAQEIQILQNYFNVQHLQRALGPVSQCTSPCVPLNFFGGAVRGDGGSITREQLSYIEQEYHNINQSNLRDWTANLSSDVYDLPAGPLGVAVGYERLDNYGYFHPDATIAAGDSSTNASSLTNGRIITDAEYAEINIPLLADLPAVKELSVDIANRWSQFQRAGGQTSQNTTSYVHNSSGRLNVRYQPITDLLLRATWAQGFRAPNINELFSGQSAAFLVTRDPCAGGGALPPNCPGGDADTQSSPQLDTRGGGNPDLEPESSISRTIGFVYSPSQVPGLDINADYYKIELSNAIATIGGQNIVNGCFFNNTFCDLLTVNHNQVTRIVNTSTNIGGFLNEGIDVGLHYKFPSTPFGDFDARIAGTFIKTFDETLPNAATGTSFATSHLAGVERAGGYSGIPKRKFNGYLDWDYGNWSAQYHIEFLDGLVEPCLVATDLCTPSLQNNTVNFQGTLGQFNNGRNHLGATVYHDINIAYTVPRINTTFAVGVQNLFDKNPPISRAGQIRGNFDKATYRLPSRLVYGDIRVKF